MTSDPDYARAFTKIRCVAWSHGYAAMLHGTGTRDLDVLCAPWTEKPDPVEVLVPHIMSALASDWKDTKQPKIKPHGRRVWTLIAAKFGDPRFIDLGVMPVGAAAASSSEA